ncbi:5609_t:CDS:2 [Funneliformis caledonium]|uniref:5609_t:CDS:1 n=1 Tax=Funneliformis caledonium TaxID=1117310 RepID=A0A9N9E4V4_9GLOM|nr:5609_t:CDS:2 [Funneliformis caledonium]
MNNLLQTKRIIAERNRELQDIQNALKNTKSLNRILQEDFARITEKLQLLSSSSSSERVSIRTL